MLALKMAIAAVALLALCGCVVDPYDTPAYYSDSGYYYGGYGGPDVGVSVGAVNVGGSYEHPDGYYREGDDGGWRR